MYAVVGCSDCSALWVIDPDPETVTCPRCGTRHRVDQLKRFVETDDEAEARELRASMLANRQEEGEAFAAVDAYDELESRLDEAGVDDATYLTAQGVDQDATAAAGERATQGTGGGQSKQETVRSALKTLDQPTEIEVIAYADERGVSPEYVRDALAKLQRTGEVLCQDGHYRLL